MTEKKPKQLWPQTPLQWLGVLVLLFLAYSAWEAVGNIFADPFPESTAAIEETRRALDEYDRLTKEYEEKYPSPIAVPEETQSVDNRGIILGRWRYWGSLEYGNDPNLNLTMTFFTGGVYSQTERYTHSITGRYEVSSDGQLMTTQESCENGLCQPVTYTNGISFPDRNTMHLNNDGLILVFNREY